MLPGELKKMFAQVVQAQKEGQAALERARGETAALRNLANAAQLVDANPALMRLRLLQQLSSSSGHTIVLGFPDSSIPLGVQRTERPTYACGSRREARGAVTERAPVTRGPSHVAKRRLTGCL